MDDTIVCLRQFMSTQHPFLIIEHLITQDSVIRNLSKINCIQNFSTTKQKRHSIIFVFSRLQQTIHIKFRQNSKPLVKLISNSRSNEK